MKKKKKIENSSVTYLLRNFRFFFVAQSDYGQHQIDQVKRTEENHHGKEYHAHWPARRQHL